MRLFLTTGVVIASLLVAVTLAQAQPGGGKDKGGKGSTETVDDFVKKLMTFNKAKDGKLTKEELTDKRLHALFDRADSNKDGVVTREELEALFAREKPEGGGGKGGPGGDKGKGPQPGQVIPSFIADAIDLTDAQKKQAAELQKEVDARLEAILTPEQRTLLRAMRNKGPKGPPDKK